MSDNPVPVMVTPKAFWQSRTNRYNAIKAAIGYVTAILTVIVAMANNGALPFEIDVRWPLLIIALLAITDGHIGMWLRGDTDAPIAKGE